jgi:hypothetical protein
MMQDDEVAKKRQMIQVLMGALKKHAGDEVMGGMKPKEKEAHMTHTPVPTSSVADMPHKKEQYGSKSSPNKMGKPENMEMASEEQMAPMGMKEGGMVDLSKPFAKDAQPASDSSKMAMGGDVMQHPGQGEYCEMCKGGCSYADGGMAASTDQPERAMESDAVSVPDTNDALENLPEKPMDEEGSEETQQNEHNKENEEEDENNNQSAFNAFFKRKKK